MAVDKLVDSTQLDADLTSVANAIRTKGGTSGQLAFPAGFISAVGAIEGLPGYAGHYVFEPTEDVLEVSVPIGTGKRKVVIISNYDFTGSGTVVFAGVIGMNSGGSIATVSRVLTRTSSGNVSYYASNGGGGQSWTYIDGVLRIANTSGWVLRGGVRYDIFWA